MDAFLRIAALTGRITLPVAGTLLCYVLYHALPRLYAEFTSPFRSMPGPPSVSWITGNYTQISSSQEVHDDWRERFGRIFKFRLLFSLSAIHVQDVKAIAHVAANGNIYQKPAIALRDLERSMGRGILAVEAEEHKRHRRVLNQAFGYVQIRLLTETFVNKAIHLRDIWLRELQTSPSSDGRILDVFEWLRRMTLDVIGEAGFGYEFSALQPVDGEANALNECFTELFHSPRSQTQAMYRLAQTTVPILKLVPFPGMRMFARVRAQLDAIGHEILRRSRAALADPQDLSGKRDLLSILLKANLSVQERLRLSDDEVIAQIPTFVAAGHETTSTAVSWALHALSKQPQLQNKLRAEVRAFTPVGENPTMDELNGLTYLDYVVRETMRLHSVVVWTQRMAMESDVLPLERPYVDPKGKVHESLVIPKGQLVHIPILAINTDPEIWGTDAGEFRPERWEKLPSAVNDIPGVWSNLLSFFAGPHNCIGFRFAIVEMKAILYVLLRSFEFTPAPGVDIGRSGFAMQRPVVESKEGKKSALPMLVKVCAVYAAGD